MKVQRRTALWLSHHYPNEYDRCIHVAGRHVCRRCAVFYPVCFTVTVLALAGVRWAPGLDTWLVWLLPVPVVVEWWLEHLGLLAYSARRNVALTLICAPAVGVGLARYLENPGDTLFWSVVAVYAVVCLLPVLIGTRGGRTSTHGNATHGNATHGNAIHGNVTDRSAIGTNPEEVVEAE